MADRDTDPSRPAQRRRLNPTVEGGGDGGGGEDLVVVQGEYLDVNRILIEYNALVAQRQQLLQRLDHLEMMVENARPIMHDISERNEELVEELEERERQLQIAHEVIHQMTNTGPRRSQRRTRE